MREGQAKAIYPEEVSRWYDFLRENYEGVAASARWANELATRHNLSPPLRPLVATPLVLKFRDEEMASLEMEAAAATGQARCRYRIVRFLPGFRYCRSRHISTIFVLFHVLLVVGGSNLDRLSCCGRERHSHGVFLGKPPGPVVCTPFCFGVPTSHLCLLKHWWYVLIAKVHVFASSPVVLDSHQHSFSGCGSFVLCLSRPLRRLRV